MIIIFKSGPRAVA